MQQDKQPFQILADWSSKVDEALENQKNKKDFSNLESCIGFTLCAQAMSSSVGDVVEIMNVPTYTPIPGTKNWVLGMANVRGTLLPIIDMERFFGGVNTASKRNLRVLVIENKGALVGLLVSSVTGLQHLSRDEYEPAEVAEDTTYAQYIDGVYEYENKQWYKFNPLKLLGSKEFMDASVVTQSGAVEAA